MVAIVSRERARATWLTGLAGLLLLSAALTMMAMAAPVHVRWRPLVEAAPLARGVPAGIPQSPLFRGEMGLDISLATVQRGSVHERFAVCSADPGITRLAAGRDRALPGQADEGDQLCRHDPAASHHLHRDCAAAGGVRSFGAHAQPDPRLVGHPGRPDLDPHRSGAQRQGDEEAQGTRLRPARRSRLTGLIRSALRHPDGPATSLTIISAFNKPQKWSC